ncbi:MAG: hypothetical protein KBG28_13740 [Kofleriaceae bacterium]|nr:hypothetical protein [Kofleriaceae bacterium]
MRASLLLLSILGAACGGARPVDPPMGYAGHLQEADRHERVAAEHDDLARAKEGKDGGWCGDPGPPTTSGGEPVTRWQPCWATDRADAAAHRERADRERVEARQHRVAARHLVEVERTFCAGLPASELEHTPLQHADDIASIEPYRELGDTVGARIVFRKVAGLDPDWLRDAVLCHQARAAALGVGAGLAADPTTVPMSSIAVLDQGGQVVLIIRGMTDEATAEILARAMALAPRK